MILPPKVKHHLRKIPVPDMRSSLLCSWKWVSKNLANSTTAYGCCLRSPRHGKKITIDKGTTLQKLVLKDSELDLT